MVVPYLGALRGDRQAGSVSSSIPYVAPWQTGFERFATQHYAVALNPTGNAQWTIPDGQWWRIISATGFLTASGAAGNRTAALEVFDAGGVLVYAAETPLVIVATQAASYTFGLNIAAISNAALPAVQFGSAPIIDALWPQASLIIIDDVGRQVGDTYSTTTGGILVEIYAEQRPGVLVPQLTPTPLVS